MKFHYGKDKAICGREIEKNYLSEDWRMVDCIRCYLYKDLKIQEKKKMKSKYER